MSSSTLTKPSAVSNPAEPMIHILSLGRPAFLAALSAVRSCGTPTNRAFAPDDVSWCVSSAAE